MAVGLPLRPNIRIRLLAGALSPSQRLEADGCVDVVAQHQLRCVHIALDRGLHRLLEQRVAKFGVMFDA
jgi:hypothetical protein